MLRRLICVLLVSLLFGILPLTAFALNNMSTSELRSVTGQKGFVASAEKIEDASASLSEKSAKESPFKRLANAKTITSRTNNRKSVLKDLDIEKNRGKVFKEFTVDAAQKRGAIRRLVQNKKPKELLCALKFKEMLFEYLPQSHLAKKIRKISPRNLDLSTIKAPPSFRGSTKPSNTRQSSNTGMQPSAPGPVQGQPATGQGVSQGGPRGNNGLGNGLDPQPPGNPPQNDGPGTSPGNPGNSPN